MISRQRLLRRNDNFLSIDRSMLTVYLDRSQIRCNILAQSFRKLENYLSWHAVDGILLGNIQSQFDLIHRDIKPSNIMLDNENRAILTDFGLAQRLTDSGLGRFGRRRGGAGRFFSSWIRHVVPIDPVAGSSFADQTVYN